MIVDGIEIHEKPLTLIGMARQRCENYWVGSCMENGGKHPNAVHGAEDYCWPCKLRHVIGLDK